MVIVKLADGVTIGKINEVLSRIGIGNNVKNTLYPTCYAFNIGKTIYVSHFKELIALEKDPNVLYTKETGLTIEDLHRRDNIIELLDTWGLISIVSEDVKGKPKQNFKILKVFEKFSWEIQHKYTM